MRLYLDNQYTPGFIRLISSLHAMEREAKYEVISGIWKDDYRPDSTVVFLWDISEKGLSRQILNHYNDGYKVFVYRKPFGKPFNPYRVSLLILSQWKKILKLIETERKPFLFAISDTKVPMKRII